MISTGSQAVSPWTMGRQRRTKKAAVVEENEPYSPLELYKNNSQEKNHQKRFESIKKQWEAGANRRSVEAAAKRSSVDELFSKCLGCTSSQKDESTEISSLRRIEDAAYARALAHREARNLSYMMRLDAAFTKLVEAWARAAAASSCAFGAVIANEKKIAALRSSSPKHDQASAAPDPSEEALKDHTGEKSHLESIFLQHVSSLTELAPVSRLEAMLDDLGHGLAAEALDEAFHFVDPDSTGYFTYAQFSDYIEDLEGSDDEENEDDLAEERTIAAEAFDKETSSNSLSADRFQPLLESMGTTYCEEDHDACRLKVLNAQGRIDRNTFIEWYARWVLGYDDDDQHSDNEHSQNQANNESEIAAKWALLSKPQPGQWKCAMCNVPNADEAQVCVACETPNPNAKKSCHEPSTTKPAASSAISSSGFTFPSSIQKTESKPTTQLAVQPSAFTFTNPTFGESAPKADSGFVFKTAAAESPAKATGFNFSAQTVNSTSNAASSLSEPAATAHSATTKRTHSNFTTPTLSAPTNNKKSLGFNLTSPQVPTTDTPIKTADKDKAVSFNFSAPSAATPSSTAIGFSFSSPLLTSSANTSTKPVGLNLTASSLTSPTTSAKAATSSIPPPSISISDNAVDSTEPKKNTSTGFSFSIPSAANPTSKGFSFSPPTSSTSDNLSQSSREKDETKSSGFSFSTPSTIPETSTDKQNRFTFTAPSLPSFKPSNSTVESTEENTKTIPDSSAIAPNLKSEKTKPIGFTFAPLSVPDSGVNKTEENAQKNAPSFSFGSPAMSDLAVKSTIKDESEASGFSFSIPTVGTSISRRQDDEQKLGFSFNTPTTSAQAKKVESTGFTFKSAKDTEPMLDSFHFTASSSNLTGKSSGFTFNKPASGLKLASQSSEDVPAASHTKNKRKKDIYEAGPSAAAQTLESAPTDFTFSPINTRTDTVRSGFSFKATSDLNIGTLGPTSSGGLIVAPLAPEDAKSPVRLPETKTPINDAIDEAPSEDESYQYEDKGRAAEAFDKIAKDGFVPLSAVEDLLEELGEGFYGDELEHQLERIDPDGTGKVSREAFIDYYDHLIDGDDSSADDIEEELEEERERARNAFDALDHESNGTLEASEFKSLLESMGTTYCDEDHDACRDKVLDAGGRIERDLFVQWYASWVMNDDDDDDDDTASSERPDEAELAAKWAAFSKPKDGQWKCATCDILNAEGADMCAACETPNPNQTVARKPIMHQATLPNFGTSSAFSAPSIATFGSSARVGLAPDSTKSPSFSFSNASDNALSAPPSSGFTFSNINPPPEPSSDPKPSGFSFSQPVAQPLSSSDALSSTPGTTGFSFGSAAAAPATTGFSFSFGDTTKPTT